MDNKLVKRIVALASSAVMLSSCAFATTLSSASYTDGSLTFNYNADGADKVTYIAYAAKVVEEGTADWTAADGTKYVFCENEGNDVIVALDQIDNIASDAGATEKVQAVDATKIPEDATAIVIKSGDSKGTVAAGIAAPLTVETKKYAVKNGSETIELDIVDGKITLPKTATFTKTSPANSTFALYSWVAVDASNAETEYALDAVVNVSDLEGKTVYAKYLCNTPYGDVDNNGSITADDYGDILRVVKGRSARKNTGKLIVANYDALVSGDVDATKTITADDYGDVLRVVKGRSARKNTGKAIYYVNKD